jgi:autoinducer 2-degrading protein
MFIVSVDVWVKAGSIEAFIEATQQNAAASLREPGIARFDVLQDQSNPAHFQLLEVYRSQAAPGDHKQTAHYARWRDAVEPMMERPRTSLKFDNVFPSDEGF